MGDANRFLFSATFICLAASGCAPNRVQPGFYEGDAGSLVDRRAAKAQTPAAPNTVPANAEAAAPVAIGGGTVAASAGRPAAGASGHAITGGNPALAQPATRECDLSGRWLITNKFVLDAQGQSQVVHRWLYYELMQSGDVVTVTKGLHCGEETLSTSDFGANADSSLYWPGVMKRLNDAGRSGRSSRTSAGCEVAFDKWYGATGATLPHYLDPTYPLPEQPAMGAQPGWEDWDEDGKPGVTVVVSGIISGKIFICTRDWHAYSGVIADVAKPFIVADDWNQEMLVLAFEGSELLTTQAVRSADPSLHFAEFARLSDTQVEGDDAAICAKVRDLAPMLTPNASAN